MVNVAGQGNDALIVLYDLSPLKTGGKISSDLSANSKTILVQKMNRESGSAIGITNIRPDIAYFDGDTTAPTGKKYMIAISDYGGKVGYTDIYISNIVDNL